MERKFDLEERTTQFGKEVVQLCLQIPRNPINDRLINQAVGSAGSVGACYREANDALGKKDFIQRAKMARREAKEVQHWLELMQVANKHNRPRIEFLMNEASQLRKILSVIIKKCED